MKLAIIGGTGLETLPAEYHSAYHIEPLTINTPFGEAAVSQVLQTNTGNEFLFLSRHGATHGLAPHQINYRANIAALVQLGVERVFATNAVGSLRKDLPPGSLVLLDDFIDFNRSRPLSYWDDHPARPAALQGQVVHTDFSKPYCPELRHALLDSSANREPSLVPTGTYVCADGPRFESPAEIRMFAKWGGDVVGMTGLPEAIFAREAGLCYSAIAIVTNFGSGLVEGPVDHEAVLSEMRVNVERVRDLLLASAGRVPIERSCRCGG